MVETFPKFVFGKGHGMIVETRDYPFEDQVWLVFARDRQW
jgi:hypothetical protein